MVLSPKICCHHVSFHSSWLLFFSSFYLRHQADCFNLKLFSGLTADTNGRPAAQSEDLLMEQSSELAVALSSEWDVTLHQGESLSSDSLPLFLCFSSRTVLRLPRGANCRAKHRGWMLMPTRHTMQGCCMECNMLASCRNSEKLLQVSADCRCLIMVSEEERGWWKVCCVETGRSFIYKIKNERVCVPVSLLMVCCRHFLKWKRLMATGWSRYRAL